MTVYIIVAGRSSQDENAVTERDNLGKAIGTLAKSAKTPVFFHDYTGNVGGAPVILLECSKTFLEDVQKLPGFTLAMEKVSSLPTARSDALWNYFTGESAPPARAPAAKKPPRQFQL
jgi:hypothetical protein